MNSCSKSEVCECSQQSENVMLLRQVLAEERPETPPAAPLLHQVGGAHYKDLKIQPIEYIHANNIPFAEASVIKYVTRWRAKGGMADLEKAKHFIELLIELETREGSDGA